MATSGTITGTVSGNSLITSRITWTLNSQSVANNTSSVTVTLAYKRSDSQLTYGTGSWKLTINGTSYTGSSYKEISSSWVNVFSKTVTITHDSNGAKTFSMNASGSYIPGTSLEGTKCSGSGTLTTIPRASSFNSVTSSVELGSKVTLSITPKSANFYHKFTFKCGSTTAEYKPGKTTSTNAVSYQYTIPTGWSNQITTATSKSVSVTMQTYSNEACTTAVGSSVTKNFTVTVPNNSTYNPTVSLAATLGNATGLGSSTYVQGRTSINLSATGSAKADASIKSYVFKRASTTLKTVTSTSTSASASETTNTTGSVTYSVTITDSRGRTATASQTITVYAYSAPTLTINNLYRSNSDGTKNTTSGTCFYIKATFTYTSSGGNSIDSSTVKYKLPSDSGWRDGANLTSSVGVTLGNGDIDTNKNYDVYVSVVDKVGTVVSKKLTIPTIFVTMDFKAGGTGIAIGKIAEEDALFDVGMRMRLNTSNGNEARIIMLSNGYNDRELIYSNAGNIGFRDITDNNTWLIRVDSNKNVFVPGDNITIGESSDATAKDLFLENNKRKVTFSLNSNGTTGLYHSGTGWIIQADTNNNVSIPNGRFTAPKSIVHGSITITPSAANTPTSKAVTWTAMAGVPHIALGAYTGVPGTQVTGVAFNNPSATGCSIVVTRTNTNAFATHYIAIY